MMESGDAMVQRAEICRPRRASVIAVAMVAGLLPLPAGVAAQDGDATPATRTQKTAPATESQAAAGTRQPPAKGHPRECHPPPGAPHRPRPPPPQQSPPPT